MAQPIKKKKTWKRVARIVLKTILFAFLLFILLVILILTPPVQNFIRKKAVTYLENKLHTKVEIGSIYIGLPKNVVVKGIYIEDRQKDTLLAGSSVKVDIALLKLIFKQKVEINSIALEDITAKIKRQLPDTAFNFQFIIDAFNPPSDKPKEPSTDATSSEPLKIGSITLNKARLVYKDVLTGNDVETWVDHFDTRIDKFDSDNMQIDIPSINLQGVTARVYQSKPLLVDTDSSKPSAPTINPVLSLGKIDLEKINLDYRNDVSALYTTTSIGNLHVEPQKIDLNEQVISFDEITLENTNAAIRLGKKEAARELVEIAKQKTDSSLEKGWRLQVASFTSDNNTLQFDNDNLPRQKTGLDYAHIKASPFVLSAKDFLLSDDSIAGQIEKASFKEQSGFELQELQTKFLYANNQAYLHDLSLKTPGTEIKRDLSVRYTSLEKLQTDINDLQLDLDIADSRILVKDVLTFVPSLRAQPAFANPGTTWYINSRVQGRVSDLNIQTLQVMGLQDTKIDISGRVKGLPDMNNFTADVNIRNISSSRRDINLFLPPNTLPANITLPGRLSMNGVAHGNTSVLTTQLTTRTDLGDAFINGKFEQLNDPKKVKYAAIVEARAIDFGTILQDKQNLGPVTANFTVNGTGFDPATAAADIKGIVQSAVFRQYVYRDLTLQGNLANQQVNFNTGMNDPNIHFAVDGSADLSKEFPSLKLSAMIDSIKTLPLHLTPGIVIYHGKIEADFTSTNPDDLDGKLFITESILVQGEKRLQLDTVQLVASKNEKGNYLELNSDIAHAKIEGKYKLTQMGGIIERSIQPYFAVQKTTAPVPQDPYDFTVNAYITKSQAIQAFLPGLERMDSVKLQSHFSDNQDWYLVMNSPAIDYNGTRIRGLSFKIGSLDDSIQSDIVVRQISSGSMALYNTSIKAGMANNVIYFTTNVRDRANKSRYNFSAIFSQPQPGQYSFSFVPQGLLLNYDQWNIGEGNKLLISSNDITATDFVLSKNGQQLSINSLSQNPNAPLEVKFNNFRLSTITAFVQSDSSLVDGSLNGAITFSDIMKDPIFKGELNINDLSIKNDTAGNVKMIMTSTTPGVYEADVALSGRGNDVKLAGKYYVKPNNNSNFDLALNIVELPMATAQAFSAGAIKYATGSVNGKFNVTGTLDKPSVRGDLNFNKTGFNISQFNNYFAIDKEKISINEKGIRFDRFQIKDSTGNTLTLDGTANTSNFMNYDFDFTIRANNFQALNSAKKDNNLFYGQLFFNSNLRVKGTELAPVIDGSLTVNEKTKMTIVLPQREPGVVDREGIVEFVDKDAPISDSLFLAAYDSLNTFSLKGLDITANIEVDKNAQFSLIIDEGNGDFLNVRGEASLTTGIDPSGKLTLAGSYELEEGSYELTFNLIKRKFNIEKGSKIVWLGEPTDADVDITAIYVANTAPLDLVKNELGEDVAVTQRNTYLQKLPFEVLLKMEGKLLKPDISFDIRLPENKSYGVGNDILTNVRTKLDQLRQETGEMNKQVFALLLLNRFIGENPFNSSSEGISANTLARQSVSKLLTEQLNKLAGNLIEGVDLNFDVVSSEDYTTGSRQDRTDLNVGLSKQLLNDRLTVTVGSNFELEGAQNSGQRSNNIAGDVALNYRLSNDGRYMLRAYRKNEYEGIIDGYIIETGVSFIISIDYNKFKQIFQSIAQRRKERENRRKQRQQERAQANAAMKEDEQQQQNP